MLHYFSIFIYYNMVVVLMIFITLYPYSTILLSMLQPASPIRKLLQTSYHHPSEGRQNENHNHRKLTKLITWTTTLSNSMKLWAVPCRAYQDGWVIMESSDKMWSDLPDPGIDPRSPTLGVDSLPSESNHTLTWWKKFFSIIHTAYCCWAPLFFVVVVSCSSSYLEYVLNMSRKDLCCHVADIVAEENKK